MTTLVCPGKCEARLRYQSQVNLNTKYGRGLGMLVPVGSFPSSPWFSGKNVGFFKDNLRLKLNNGVIFY